MVEANRCECHPKDDEGANDGIWFTLEVINIPYYSMNCVEGVTVTAVSNQSVNESMSLYYPAATSA